MCLRLNTSAGATSASITVQRAALFAGAATSKTHVTGRVNTWSGATMINRGSRFEVRICLNCLMWSDDQRAVIARETVSKFKHLREKEDISISNE